MTKHDCFLEVRRKVRTVKENRPTRVTKKTEKVTREMKKSDWRKQQKWQNEKSCKKHTELP